MPPFTIGSTAVTSCSGEMAMPAPNDTVIVAAKPQLLKDGNCGFGGPGSWILSGWKNCWRVYQFCSIFGPNIVAMREAPILDDTLRISGTAIQVLAGSKSVIWKRPTFSGCVVSK